MAKWLDRLLGRAPAPSQASDGASVLARLEAIRYAIWVNDVDASAPEWQRRHRQLMHWSMSAGQAKPQEGASLLAAALAEEASPLRSRQAIVTFRDGSHRQGLLQNASSSHLGSLEAILVVDHEPKHAEMIPFDDLVSVEILRSSIFMAARLVFEAEHRVAIAWLPLLYATSRFHDDPALNDGRLTRFLPLSGATMEGGKVGLGHQDFELKQEDRTTLIGIGNVARIEFPLNVHDHDFEQRCARRGVSPEAVRASFYSGIADGTLDRDEEGNLGRSPQRG
jgi:hypothetical protein